MIFTVPTDFKGSCVLSTLNKALWKGMTVSIYGEDLYAPDVKLAIKRGILVPLGEDYDKEKAKLSNEAMVVNKTNKKLVLENIILKPWASRLINKSIIKSPIIQAAQKNGFIEIVSDETKYSVKESGESKTLAEEKTLEKKDVQSEEELKRVVPPETGADKEVTPTVWNFREKAMENAQVVPKTPDIVKVEEEGKEIDFIDNEKETEDISIGKKRTRRKTTKKKSVKKTIKKEGKATKSKKVKLIEPVGEKKILKTVADAAIELDSQGHPMTKPSDTLQHLIDSLTEPENMSFVDEEQAQDRLDKRIDME